MNARDLEESVSGLILGNKTFLPGQTDKKNVKVIRMASLWASFFIIKPADALISQIYFG